MDSSLHMHVASLKVQDDIRRASATRLAKQIKPASRPVAWVTLSRVFPQALRRA